MATKMTREEAIKIVQSATVWTDEERDALAMLIPELAESEDERIRKVIYILMLGMRKEIFTTQDEIVTKEKVLAYLEKQKEQKPAEWSEEDERIRKAILGFVNPDKGDTKYSSYAELVEWSNWLKSLRPSWKPSEEQMNALKVTLDYMPDTFKPRCTLMTLQDDLKKQM